MTNFKIYNPPKMKYFFLILGFISTNSFSQPADTLQGFEHKINGEEINYFSPLHQFAQTALLTRANGLMPISWEAPAYTGNKQNVTYELLIGHSTGTSSADRKFDVLLDGNKLFTITTLMKKTGNYSLKNKIDDNTGYNFIQQEYDVNNDAFGKLFITVPAALVNTKAVFTIIGQNENSQDWLMIFMYLKGLKIIAQPTNLVTQKENKRQLNLFIDNPYADHSTVSIKIRSNILNTTLKTGYNKLNIPAYDKNITGADTIQSIINNKDTIHTVVELKPIRNYTFYLIHHSHNDIGYSNLQTDVEKIQNRNIEDAINWIAGNKNAKEKPYWNIESMWAVENYLNTAGKEKIARFVDAVKSDHLALSANYANILTGLCQPQEQTWALEYAKQLEKQFVFTFQNVMITDIPGISKSALSAYVKNHIRYLCLGPNYVDNLPDNGDRVGHVIKEQGDKIFYWKPDSASAEKLLVWTAGKGYSFFHGISESEKQQVWEQKISQYCNELVNKNYPYDIVQLHYTKNSDNGPVDTMLCSFVENWNRQYKTPQLKIASVNTLFKEFEEKYKKEIPIYTGEISPYWEDGAYSTAIEEMDNRELALKTISLEKLARQKNKYATYEQIFYRLHRSIIMFDEHTWGAWSSISNPEIPFTIEQWRIKKQFLDSAKYYYQKLSSLLAFKYLPEINNSKVNKPIEDFIIDTIHGGLKSITVSHTNIVSQSSGYNFFEPIYALGVNPTHFYKAEQVNITTIENSETKKEIQVTASLPSMNKITITYILYKKQGRLTCHYSFYKSIEKDKESMHIAMPFNFTAPVKKYGSEGNMLQFNRDQLPGSNKEFICVEKNVIVQSKILTANISAPKLCLWEIGNIIDENKTNGVKVWKTVNDKTSDLFLYVFNNYWHTNYKAYQEGNFDFEIELSF